MSPGQVLVLGATSGIAKAIARELATEGCDLVLAGRDTEELKAIATDINLRTGVLVQVIAYDAETQGTEIFDTAEEQFGPISGLVLAVGFLGDQAKAQADWGHCKQIVDSNFVFAVPVLHAAAARFEERKVGWIVALSSVAGDRGRMSNYVYGSAKAGLTVFLQGLRARLQKSGVHVLTVKPGPVDTAMTFGMDKLPLLAQPGDIAKQVVRALKMGKDVAYVPGPWRPIMFVLRSVPEKIFKKTSL